MTPARGDTLRMIATTRVVFGTGGGPAQIRLTKRAAPDRPGTPCPADGRAAIVAELPELSRPESTTNPNPSAATGRSV